jgi:citrate lyase subunit beta/citryl-CoA lyase
MGPSRSEPRRLRRSLLFVPAAEPRKIERARDARADTVVLDLEDSVAPPQKAEARGRVTEVLGTGVLGTTEAVVRVNAAGTPHFESDLRAVIAGGGRTIVLPKAEGGGELTHALDTLERLEREVPGAPAGGLKILALVETPAGIADARAIGRASPRIEALCFGHADFSLAMGLTEADAAHGIAYHARCALVIAAKACDVVPIDSVHLAVKDTDAFREDAALGLRLGFEGKLCIHPAQVEIANEVYTPRPEEVDYAVRVIEAWERAQAEGRGVFTLDGRMIDAPLVAVQQRVLDRARRAGVHSRE